MIRPINIYYQLPKTIFLILLVLLSCRSKKGLEPEEIVLKNNPKLLFLNYSLKKTNDNRLHATFINKITTDGKLKNNHLKFIKNPSIGDLKCAQLDKNSSELISVFIKNPLIKIIEALDDSLSFSRYKIEQKRAPISLKLQLHAETKFISLSTITDSTNNTIELIKTELE
jgi:hypothetical protein